MKTTEQLERHRIDITIDTRSGIGHKFHCAATEGASCRLVCPDGCEEFSTTNHVSDTLGDDREWLQPLTDEERTDLVRRHTLVDGGECNSLTFLENDPDYFWELYDGEPAPIHSGPVEFVWNGEFVTWHYTPAEGAA
jgi:hypothetical protein